MIFYFSGTGNSKWVAGMVANQTGEKLISIPEAVKENCHFQLKEEEMIGFIFPVHGWRVPKIVIEFLQKLNFTGEVTDTKKPHYCFCLLTAGDTIGKTMERFRKQFAEIKSETALELHLVGSLIMPESYVGLPGMDVDTDEKEKTKLKKTEEETAVFCKLLNERAKSNDAQPLGWQSLMRGPIPGFFSGPIGAVFTNWLISDKPFRVESEKCVKCGICASICPVNDIRGGLGMEPEWLHNGKCLTCFACYHHCPHHAIEYGNRTRKKGQYFFGRKKLNRK